MSYKILSCDGGGIRGLITALLIQDLDQRSQIVARADGFAGTSTGGLLALALANEVPLATIIDVYKTKGAEIFKENSFLNQRQAEVKVDGTLFAGPGYFGSQYVNTGLKSIAEGFFKSRKLTDLARFVVVNAARLWDPAVNSWTPCTFSNHPLNAFRGISVVDAALATSAAPTYFPPYEVAGFGYFADGGVFANNPSMTAVTEALASQRASSLADLRILSLGTGESREGVTPQAVANPLDWGVLRWLWPAESHQVPATALLNLTLDATAMLATQQAGQVLANRYQRGNVPLTQIVGLDEWQKVAILEQQTQAYIQTPAWQKVRNWVDENWR
jgi:uncharacterized protein